MKTSTKLDIKKDEMLSQHCRFSVGGPADFFVEVTTAEEMRDAITYATDNHLKYFIYSGGSNIFFDDKGFRGLVIRMIGGSFKVLHDGLVYVDAGYPLPKLVRDLARLDLGGLEFLGNIPGSIGGAVAGNAGCYGKSISEVLQEARVYSVADKKMKVWKPIDFGFEYRHSRIKFDTDYIVLNVTLKTAPNSFGEIMDVIGRELDERLSKHPHHAKCAGSFFKNPAGMSAWKIITEAGMQDANVGDAMISPKHANFLINNGQATSQDIIELTHQIQTSVKKKTDISLEPEVRYVGEHGLIENL
jgi:UDP-N-acetylmuramate dehydrogenase